MTNAPSGGVLLVEDVAFFLCIAGEMPVSPDVWILLLTSS